MEHAYIGGIQRFSTEDGPGIRTTVFFKGCPLSCKWCHNPELLDPEYGVLYKEKDCIRCGRCVKACPHSAIRMEMPEQKEGEEKQLSVIVIDRSKCDGCGACVDACPALAMFTKSVGYETGELIELISRDRDYYESSGGGITLSGGEILMHADHAAEVARAVKDEGFSLAIETSGFGKYEDLEMLADIADCILFDVKHMDPERHAEFIGADNKLIQENLKKLAAREMNRDKVIIRIPLVHQVNDDEENIKAVIAMMKENGFKRVDLLPYHNMGVGKAAQAGLYQETFETPSDEILERLRTMFKEAGLSPKVMGHED